MDDGDMLGVGKKFQLKFKYKHNVNIRHSEKQLFRKEKKCPPPAYYQTDMKVEQRRTIPCWEKTRFFKSNSLLLLSLSFCFSPALFISPPLPLLPSISPSTFSLSKSPKYLIICLELVLSCHAQYND